MPQFRFYKKIAKLGDLRDYYCTVFEGKEEKLKSVALGKVCEQLLGQVIDKSERMSNWERRPLRLAQLHYGSLDAYCMLPAIKALIAMADESGDKERSFEKNICSYTKSDVTNDQPK